MLHLLQVNPFFLWFEFFYMGIIFREDFYLRVLIAKKRQIKDLKQGSTLTLTRSPLESDISEWKVKKANEPKILARSGNYF